MSVVKPTLNTDHGISTLTQKGHDMLKSCIKANPNGCRSSDGECGPPPTYPCFSLCGLSWNEWGTYFRDQKDRMAAKPIEEEL